MMDEGDPSTGTTVVSTDNLFMEKDEAIDMVAVIQSNSASSDDKDKALVRVRRIFDNYLECPSLLDQHVGDLVGRLVKVPSDIIRSNSSTNDGDGVTGMTLDQCLHSFSAIYSLSKVRGRKTISRLLPHEVKDVHPVLEALEQMSTRDTMIKPAPNSAEVSSSFANEGDKPQRWESVYVLWNWMGTLSLVPFDCSVVLDDSARFLSSLIDLGKRYLSKTGPTREAAACCLAAWLSRPDLEKSELPKFVDWSREVLQETTTATTEGRKPMSIFLLLGVLQTIVTILKVATASRENLISSMNPLWDHFIILAESNMCDNNLLLRKYMVKWWSRMGCMYLPPRVASWRYQRGRRSLEQNLQQADKKKETIHKELGTTTATIPITSELSVQAPQHAQDLFLVPDYVEDAMGFVLHSLKDSSTTVRWPAAKGVGRLTERLPSVCADDVLDAVLELFVDPGADQAWHGGCLALAELARRGLLLPHRLSEVVPQIVRAIQYDVRRGQTSVGVHVRDAACYTYWSFARSFHPSCLQPYVSVLSESIVLTCLFDREVNCRRAASAAFQECVGRQGADNFKHGISILTAADYFAIGNRGDAFTRIALHVAQYEEYRRKIITHVYFIKLRHWDENIRTLASKSLHGLAQLDRKHMTAVVFPALLKSSLDPKNVQVRHGSILGLAEGILALGEREKIEEILPVGLLQEIAELVPMIEKKRLYRGRGGEMVRVAVCRFIHCICEAKVPLIARQQVRLLDSIDACAPHPNEDIQAKACGALRALTFNYFPVGPKGPSDRLQKRVIDKYLTTIRTSENPASTRGFTLALGHLPGKLLAPSPAVLGSVLSVLRKAGRHDARVGREKDAETRRNALIALRRVCETVGIAADLRREGEDEMSHFGLDAKNVITTFDSFFTGLDDYNVDKRRGDVGSWCRIEAMKGLKAMSCLVVEQAKVGTLPELFSKDTSARLVRGLLKQLSEKLNNVRVEAGHCLQDLLMMEGPKAPFIQEKGFLKGCLGLTQQDEGADNVNWADASVTFPMVARAAKVEGYFPSIIAGMVISIGGLTESVTKHSTAALLQLAKEARGTPQIFNLGSVLLDLFQSHTREGRVILPLLKTIDILLSHQCLDELVANDANGFKSSLVQHIYTEAKNCTDVHRQFACVDVALGLVGSTPNHKQQEGDDAPALTFACSQLLHRFPRVRSYAAEQIYVCLLEHRPELVEPVSVPKGGRGEGNDDSLFALESILDFAWDGEQTSAQQCREMAQTIASVVGVTLPSIEPNGVTSREKSLGPKDDFATYSSLVDSVSNKG